MEKIINQLINELEDAISFMELFDNDSLGEEKRLDRKIDAVQSAEAFLHEYSIPKVKVFRFRVSNESSVLLDDIEDKSTKWYKQAIHEVESEVDIENCINRFLEDKQLLSLQVSTVDVGYHNNARGNTIDLVYSLSYKKKMQ